MRRPQLLEMCRCAGLAVAVLAAIVLAGCGGGGSGSPAPADTTPPALGDTSWTNSLPVTGGNVTIDVTAIDSGSGIAHVEVSIVPPTGPTITRQMSNSGGNTYAYTYQAPANGGATKLTYKFTVSAVDKSGNSVTTIQYAFDVPCSETPPPPPFVVGSLAG